MTLTNIEKLVKRYTEYDVIQMYTDLPAYPELRVRLLDAYLKETGMESSRSELFSLVTAIIQMGLDAHEQVPVRNTLKTKPEARNRQLKVLAGAYFSSRYYNLLAEAGEVAAVKLLASSVSEINRLKLALYVKIKQMKVTAEEYIRQRVQIQAQLFLSFAELIPDYARKTLTDLIYGVSRFEVLAGELDRLREDQAAIESWGFWHVHDMGSRDERKQLAAGASDPSRLKALLLKYKAGQQLQHLLEEEAGHICRKLREVNSERLLEELRPLTERLSRAMGKARILEER
ncbi:heptaprenyl diphosphate synthase component 1 [Gorillibacterium sp. CAU 1737]|uniref:heptaprenyl diphosphate synthase component 1 n=1 Tax=Gorillibacterium sp. CAU 1737 TaxID=3140362 RepID=UPI0032617C34